MQVAGGGFKIGGMPIVRPNSPEKFAEEIRAACGAKRVVHVQGSGSHAGPEGVQVLATTRMNALVEHSVPDMVVTVQAGITLEVLQKQLAWQNQWLPVDPPG